MSEGIRIARRFVCTIDGCNESVRFAYLENNVCEKHYQQMDYLFCAVCDYQIDFNVKSDLKFNLQHMENRSVAGEVVHFLVEK